MELKDASTCLEALGNPKRLAIFRLLVSAGEDGLSFGTIQKALDAAASTLNHHVSYLVRAGLVCQERKGREVVSRCCFERMHTLVDFLTAECCSGVCLHTLQPDDLSENVGDAA